MKIASWQHNTIKDLKSKPEDEDLIKGRVGGKLLKQTRKVLFKGGDSSECTKSGRIVENEHVMSTLPDGKGNKLDRTQSCRTSPVSDSVDPGIIGSDKTEYFSEPATTELNKIKVASVDHHRNDVIQSTSPLANGVEAEQELVPCSSDTMIGRLDGKDASRDMGASESYPQEAKDSFKSNDKLDVVHGGAVWDIFRIQDTPKLIKYLEKQKNEFRHLNNHPVDSVSSVIYFVKYTVCTLYKRVQ